MIESLLVLSVGLIWGLVEVSVVMLSMLNKG